MLGLWNLCFEFDWWVNLDVAGLIIVGIWLFGWFWEIELKDDDFKLWFCLNGEIVLGIWREQYVSVKNSGLEVEDGKISIWSLNFGKLQFSPQTLENYRLVPGTYSEILNRITYELWTELLYR